MDSIYDTFMDSIYDTFYFKWYNKPSLFLDLWKSSPKEIALSSSVISFFSYLSVLAYL